MQRVCFRLSVKPEMRDEYVRRHQEVWPEMLQALIDTGWHNYSLFLDDDGTLIGYFETPDLKAALAGMDSRDVNARWQAEMAPFFAELDGRRPDEGFRELTQIFFLATPSAPGDTAAGPVLPQE